MNLTGFMLCPHCGSRSVFSVEIDPSSREFRFPVWCVDFVGEGCGRVYDFTVAVGSGVVTRSEVSC